MKRNRKKTETYRFNGYPHLHARSIHSVTLADLESRIADFEAKLANPDDADDKKWVEHWLDRFREEMDKKQKGLELKHDERAKERPRRDARPANEVQDA